RIAAIRIDDFKYSAASSSMAKQLKQSFQIPVYAYLAARAAGAERGIAITGRYLLLRSPDNPVVSYPIGEEVFEEVHGRIEALVKTVQEGRLEPDPADRQMCLECDYRRLCRLYGGLPKFHSYGKNTETQRHKGTKARGQSSFFARLCAFVSLCLCVF